MFFLACTIVFFYHRFIMIIDIKDVFEFAKLRIECHVRALNYFATMFGYNFPDHDGDKNLEPVRTGYAYILYAIYHKNFCLTKDQELLALDAKNTHHKYASHHIQHYADIADIPDIRLYEMVSDWASANFEQKNILCIENSIELADWVNKNQLNLNWTPHQLEIIRNAVKTIENQSDTNTLRAIWQPVLALMDL